MNHHHFTNIHIRVELQTLRETTKRIIVLARQLDTTPAELVLTTMEEILPKIREALVEIDEAIVLTECARLRSTKE